MSRVLIFLDVDGVLNSLRSTIGMGGCNRAEQLDPVAIGLLRFLCNELSAAGKAPAIVISSTWRMMHTDLDWWRELLKLDVIGMTPRLGHERGHEVEAWLRANGDGDPFVCIDDDRDFLPDQRLIHTKFTDGLQLRHVAEAITALTGKPYTRFNAHLLEPEGVAA